MMACSAKSGLSDPNICYCDSTCVCTYVARINQPKLSILKWAIILPVVLLEVHGSKLESVQWSSDDVCRWVTGSFWVNHTAWVDNSARCCDMKVTANCRYEDGWVDKEALGWNVMHYFLPKLHALPKNSPVHHNHRYEPLPKYCVCRCCTSP